MDHFASKDESKNFIVDNCKNIYFAGHESTSVAASWCLMLLALHPQWQTRIRNEMFEACPNGSLDVDSLPKLKSVKFITFIHVSTSFLDVSSCSRNTEFFIVWIIRLCL